jgi:RNA polymerase sigma-70 factor, ECF subfamily
MQLVEIYGPVVYHVFLSGVAVQDRDDVFQEVFSTAWRNRERFTKTPGRPSFRAWLYRIAGHMVSNHRRGKARYRRVAPVGGCDHQEIMNHLAVNAPAIVTAEESDSDPGSTEDSWDDWIDAAEDVIVEGIKPDGEHIRILVRRQVLEIVLKEIAGQRRARDLALRQIIKGDSAQAAARAVGASVSAAYTAKSRVLMRVREILDVLGEPVDDGEELTGPFGGVES